MPVQRRLAISERERQQIRQYARANPLLRQSDIARWASIQLGHKINQSIICKSLRSNWSYLDTKTFEQSDSGTLRAYKADYPLLESALYEWIMHMEANKVSVTGEMMQSTASSLWKKMPDFQLLKEPAWSQGWLSGFKRRHKMKPSPQAPSGEATSVDLTDSVGDIHRLQLLIRRFQLKDIFSTDETGLVWLTAPEIPFPTRFRPDGNKNMITILPTCNADGSEKLDAWVLGHVENPRPFGPECRYTKNLPFEWRYNKRAWMTTTIFIEYLHWFDGQMRGRKVLLLIDRLSPHVNALKQIRDGLGGPALRNTTVAFVPTDTTFVFQPMDQGIIQNLKVHYRKAWLQHIISITMEEKDLYENTTILSAVHWIIDAWRRVTPDTIAHSWRQSQLFGPVARPRTQPLHYAEAMHLQQLAEALVREGVVREIADFDNFVNPREETIDDSHVDLIEHIAQTFSKVEDERDDNAAEQREKEPVPVADALKAVNLLLQFEEQQDDPTLGTLAQLRRSQSRITQQSLREKFSKAAMTLDLYTKGIGPT